MISASLTSYVMNVLMPYENRRRRSLDLLHHKRPLQQLLSLAVVFCITRRPRRDVKVCADITSSDKDVFRGLLASPYKVVVPRLGPRAFSSQQRPPTGIRKIPEYLLLYSSRRSTASQPCYTFIAARVFAAHNRSPSFSKCSMTSLRINVYRALLASRSLFSRTSSPALMWGLHSVRFFSSSSVFLPANTENVNHRKSPRVLSRTASE